MAHILKYCGHCKAEIQAELRRLRCSNSSYQLKFQCLSCGHSIGSALPHWQVESLGDVPAWDMRVIDQQRQEYEKRQVQWVAAFPDRQEKYQHYLHSKQWKEKRERVMVRAQYTCEGCRINPATEVHHLTYANIYREFLFELVALCCECHERYHNPPTDFQLDR